MKRLGVLSLRNATTTRHAYLRFLVDSLMSVVERLVVVCDGNDVAAYLDLDVLQKCEVVPSVKKKSCSYVCDYAKALRYLGQEQLASFDEAVFLNDGLFGPFVPLSNIFESMDARTELDFWGITRYGASELGARSLCPYLYRPEHVQLYFFAVRSRLLSCEDFTSFMNEALRYRSSAEVFDAVEAVFTPYFASRGFAWDTYVDESALISTDPSANVETSVVDPYELIAHKGFPFLRMESLGLSRTQSLDCAVQQSTHDALEHLRSHALYDVSYVYEWLLGENDLWCAQNAVGAIEIVSKEEPEAAPLDVASAVVLICSNPQTLKLASGLPAEVDLYVISDELSVADAQEVHGGLVTVLPRLGADDAECFLRECEESHLLDTYDYVAGLMEVEDDTCGNVTLGERYKEYAFHNLMGTSGLVHNILRLMRDCPEIGVLGTLPPTFGTYFSSANLSLYSEKPELQECLHALGCDDMLTKASILVPRVSSFWCKTAVLRRLIDGLQTPEPSRGGCSLSECLPYVAQSAGFMTKYVITHQTAEAEIGADEYMLESLTGTLSRIPRIRANHTFGRLLEDIRNYVRIPRPKKRGQADAPGLSHGGNQALFESATAMQKEVNRLLSIPRFNEYMDDMWRGSSQRAAVFARSRTNVIDWLPFSDEEVIAEVGGSYGEYTHVLAAKSSFVYCVETSEIKRAIIANRCRRHNNIKLLSNAEELFEACTATQVDWLVIHDLEATFSTIGEVEDFVKEASKVLGPKRVVLFCANKLGLRYASESWLIDRGELGADAKEIDLRASREELQELFSQTACPHVSFYYPHPDFIFTRMVFSDKQTPHAGSIDAGHVWRLKEERIQEQGEREALAQLATEGTYVENCNTYMVIAESTPNEVAQTLPKYVRYPADRKTRFSLRTAIYENGEIKKTCMDASGRGHIQNIKRYTPALRERYASVGIVFDRIDYGVNGLRYSFIEGEDLQSVLFKLTQEGNIAEFESRLKSYLQRICDSHDDGYFAPSREFYSVFGNASIPPRMHCAVVSNIDVNVDNIIVSPDGSYHLIDCEWVFDFPIPTTYILWRIIYFFFSRFVLDETLTSIRDALYAEYGIDDALWKTYRQMETSFQRYMGL